MSLWDLFHSLNVLRRVFLILPKCLCVRSGVCIGGCLRFAVPHILGVSSSSTFSVFAFFFFFFFFFSSFPLPVHPLDLAARHLLVFTVLQLLARPGLETVG